MPATVRNHCAKFSNSQFTKLRYILQRVVSYNTVVSYNDVVSYNSVVSYNGVVKGNGGRVNDN